MKQAKTLKHKILNQGKKNIQPMIDIYNRVLAYFIDVIDKEFDDLDSYSGKDIVRLVERLVHRTKNNPSPKYADFNVLFYKFPSYFRRSAIASAYGKVKSYRSLYQHWEKEKALFEAGGKKMKKKPPPLQPEHKEFPVLYKGNMFERTGETTCQIKVFKDHDWKWIEVRFKSQDLYKRGVYDWKVCNPKLVQIGKKYFLHISYEKDIKLKNTDIKDQTIVAVDLGLNQSAVCSAMTSDGTVLGRTFINQPKEKDQLKTITNKLRKAQRDSGYISAPNFWRRINGLQKYIVTHTAQQIIAFAKEYKADAIVFEFLDQMKVPKRFYGAKKLRFKLHYWRKKGIQNKVEEMAHYLMMRVSRINPRNTSALAFDGSGTVERNPKKDLATFSTGKVYHSDLSASYNIGARYFIRGILKTCSEKKRLSLEAKVPSLAKRTAQTLSSLTALHLAESPGIG